MSKLLITERVSGEAAIHWFFHQLNMKTLITLTSDQFMNCYNAVNFTSHEKMLMTDFSLF